MPKNIRDLAANIAEHYGDYLVILRDPKGGLEWKSSDPTWAVGAAERYLGHVRTQDLWYQTQKLEDSKWQ